MMIRVFKVEFSVRYRLQDYHDKSYDVVAKDGEDAIKKARKLIPLTEEWDDEKNKHHSDRLMKAWPCSVTFVVETDD